MTDLAQNTATNGEGSLHNAPNFVFFALAVRNAIAHSGACRPLALKAPGYICELMPESLACTTYDDDDFRVRR